MTICTSKSRQNDFRYHFGNFSYNLIDIALTINISTANNSVKNFIFLTFYQKMSEQIQWWTDQIIIFSNWKSVVEWNDIVRSAGFDMHIFDFPILHGSHKNLHLNPLFLIAVYQQNQPKTPRYCRAWDMYSDFLYRALIL